MRHTVELLRALPAGELSYIDRPDGTRLRCLSALPFDGAKSRSKSAAASTVVLAHGFLGSLTNYNLIFPELVKRGHRVITFDQRGHGGSTLGRDGTGTRPMAEDYRAVLETFDVTDAVLVGHSMGAFLSVAFCLEHADAARDRLRGMVLIGGHAGDVAKGSVQNKLQIPPLKIGLMTQLMKSRRMGHALARTLFGSERPDQAFLEVSRLSMLEMNVGPTIPILEAMIEEDHYPRLHEIAIPTRVICGEEDRTCPRWHSQRLGSDIPNAENVWLAGIGHMVVFEKPGAIVEQVTALARQQPSVVAAAS